MITHFDHNTPEGVQAVLRDLCGTPTRVRLFWGDRATGTPWNDEYHTTGTIGASRGPQKIALLLAKRHSVGGFPILTAQILRIVRIADRKILYTQVPYTPGVWTVQELPEADPLQAKGYGWAVRHDGETYGNCRTRSQAVRLADYMAGKRFTK